ncbi:unnamed protein product [Clavelina lepadiformis]|uniref:Uncharacterized protein n=1 Tax=Clavelina lepadiformis TaxID=159417 RepID=A0ABP0FX94_CLALP
MNLSDIQNSAAATTFLSAASADKSNRKPQTPLFAANSTSIFTYDTNQLNVSLHPRFSYPF